ncbi:MAG: multicopper oxidase domain-containing protein [Bacillota bacterium]
MPDGTTHYIFGFVDLTGVPQQRIFEYRGRAQLIGPLVDVREGDEVYLTLTNLGLPGRPDLDDSHTVHWHGFRQQIPIYDGVPELSLSVPVGRDFVYFFRPRDPGTYMYHCHFEPVEHIQMGMVGPLIVRPSLDHGSGRSRRRYAYNHTSTQFDREFLVFLTELDPTAHGLIAHVQEYDWTDYRPKYWLLNGRSYPHTVLRSSTGELPSQPYSARIYVNQGDRVLLRFVNLGYQQHAMQTLGIPLRVVGLDAQRLRGPNGEDLAQPRDVVFTAAGQTADVMFTAPAPGTYPFFNRSYHRNVNANSARGGMLSEVRVFRRGTLSPQQALNA